MSRNDDPFGWGVVFFVPALLIVVLGGGASVWLLVKSLVPLPLAIALIMAWVIMTCLAGIKLMCRWFPPREW